MNSKYLDLIILILLLIGAFNGGHKGFLNSFLNIIGITVSIIFSKKFMLDVSNWLIKNTCIKNKLCSSLNKKISGSSNAASFAMKFFYGDASKVNDITNIFMDIGSFICIFLFMTIILNIIKEIIFPSVKHGHLKTIDKVGGFIFGIIKSIIMISLFFLAITPIITLMPPESNISQVIYTSKIAKLFLDYNVFSLLLKNFSSTKVLFDEEFKAGFLKMLQIIHKIV